jgi:hypothetical protein
MIKGLRSWWPRQTATMKTALTVGLAVVSGAGVTWIRGTRSFLDDVLSWGISVRVPAEPMAGDWKGQQFWTVESSSGDIKIAATPPCVRDGAQCYMRVTAKPEWWATWFAGLAVFGTAFFAAARFSAYRWLDPYGFMRGDVLRVHVSIGADGSASECWKYGGVTSANRKYDVKIDYTYHGSDAAPPVITSFDFDCKEEHARRPAFTDKLSCYKSTIRFAEHVQQPYTFTVSHSVSSPAWARDAEEFEARYRDETTGEAADTDCWEYHAIHHWKRVTVEFAGLEHLSATPYAIIQYPGRPEKGLGASEWRSEDGASKRWILELANVSPQTNVVVRWKLARRGAATASSAPSSSRS